MGKRRSGWQTQKKGLFALFLLLELRGSAVAAGASGHTAPSGQLLALRLNFSINKILCSNMWAESVFLFFFLKVSAALVLHRRCGGGLLKCKSASCTFQFTVCFGAWPSLNNQLSFTFQKQLFFLSFLLFFCPSMPLQRWTATFSFRPVRG